MDIWLTAYAKTLNFTNSCLVSKIHPSVVRGWLKIYPDFKEEFEIARELYADSIRAELHRRAVKGVTQLHSVSKDGIEHFHTVYSDALLALEAKRVDPSYREKSEIDIKDDRKRGVLVVPADMSPEEFKAMLDKKRDADLANAKSYG